MLWTPLSPSLVEISYMRRGESYLCITSDCPELSNSSLGAARFLKTVKCRHRNGFLVVKVFIKPDPGLSLRTYHRRLKGIFFCWRSQLYAELYILVEKEALTDIANVYNYQAFVETEKAGYIIRQWLASNLYDRIRCILTLPYLQ